jgi:hypothetical protein
MNYTRKDDGVIDVLAERVEGLCVDMSEMKHGIAKMADPSWLPPPGCGCGP